MSPSHVYYQAVHGTWRAAFGFRITDEAAFARVEMSWLDRRRIVSMATTKGLVMSTSVDYATRGKDGIVVHTTRISKWGFTLYDAIETFTLDPNGTDVAIAREQRSFPALSHTREEGQSRAEVDASGTSAKYVFPFFGATLRQTGSIEGERVRIVQETEWCRGEHLLERVTR